MEKLVKSLPAIMPFHVQADGFYIDSEDQFVNGIY